MAKKFATSRGSAPRVSEVRRHALEQELGASISNAQLRGHRRKGELSITTLRLRKRGTNQEKLNYVVAQTRRGKSVAQAREEIGLSTVSFRKAIKGDKSFRKVKGRYVVTPLEFRFIDQDGQSREGVPLVGENARQFFAYQDALKDAREGKTLGVREEGRKRLSAFRNVKIVDADGKRVHLATDLKTIEHAEKRMDAGRRARFAEKVYEREAA